MPVFKNSGLFRAACGLVCWLAANQAVAAELGAGPAADAASACAAFRAEALPHGATLATVVWVPAAGISEAACVVSGNLVTAPTSTIRWQVQLPARERWNGKTLTYGGGGFDGFLPTESYYPLMAGPAANAYARMGSDSGHEVISFYPWGLDAVALRNHAFEANHLTLEVGTAVVQAFYGRAPTRRYMFGQSNGGRSGLVAIQRYPADYDGVIAIEPAIHQQAHQVNLGQATMRHVFGARENWLSPAKVALYAAAEIRACDRLDGLEDGVIGNVAACDYVPTELRCTAEETESCLTDGQIESIRRIYSDKDVPVTFAAGGRGYRRFGRGGAATSDWVAYIFGTDFSKRDAFNFLAPSEAARVVEGKPDTDALLHDPSKYAAEYQRLSALMDPTDPDLSAFARHGGKLLIWYGLADTCVAVYETADYFAGIQQRMGTRKVRAFARFLASPGVGHELDGPGTNEVDLISAMDRWVEQAAAPDRLVARHVDHATGAAGFSRPVCEFPKFPRYSGHGDASRAENFICAEK